MPHGGTHVVLPRCYYWRLGRDLCPDWEMGGSAALAPDDIALMVAVSSPSSFDPRQEATWTL